MDRKRRGSFEEIIFPKITNGADQYSFYNGFETSSNQSSPRESQGEHGEQQTTNAQTPLNSPPALVSAHDYGIETICYTPKLVKSLMHRRVIRISSGGVHNICIIESQSACILKDVYHAFKEGKFTDVIFKGFYQTESTLSKITSDNEKGNQ